MTQSTRAGRLLETYASLQDAAANEAIINLRPNKAIKVIGDMRKAVNAAKDFNDGKGLLSSAYATGDKKTMQAIKQLNMDTVDMYHNAAKAAARAGQTLWAKAYQEAAWSLAKVTE